MTGGPSAACVTALRRQKGVDFFLQAAPRILEAVPEARLAVVGQGPEAEVLHELARRLGLEERVGFFGFRPPAARQLRELDLFVRPSQSEAFPISILEALACGVPQVATDVGGTREAVEDGVTGALCPSEDPVALADAVIDLLRSPERRESMSAASRARHAELYTVDRMVAATATLYRRVLAGKPEASDSLPL